TRAFGSRSTTSCGSTSAGWRAGRTPPAGRSSTARPSRPRKRVAPRATTREKKIGGRKRHLLVDTLGLIWGLVVLPANVQDWDGAKEVFRRAGGSLPRLAKVWADALYRALAGWVAATCTWVLEIVTGRPGATRFEVQPMRWIVERTFGWFGRYRRLSKDYEKYPRNSETWIYVAMMHRMSRFMLPQRNRDDHLLRRPRLRRKP